MGLGREVGERGQLEGCLLLSPSKLRVGGREEKRNAVVGARAYAASCLGDRGAENQRAEQAQGQQLRFDRDLKNEGCIEQREVKEASGGISHSREHMPGEDKEDRKPCRDRAGAAPVSEERPLQKPG